jgi:uncharacterized cupredoxin-like copper-binding protein
MPRSLATGNAGALAMLALVAACAAPRAPIEPAAEAEARLAAVDWGAAERVQLVLTEYEFQPATLHLRTGRPYRLELVNRGGSTHDFTAPALLAAAALPDAPASAEALASGGTIALAAGESKQLDLLPLHAGRYPLECSRPFHAVFGMTGEIVVE